MKNTRTPLLYMVCLLFVGFLMAAIPADSGYQVGDTARRDRDTARKAREDFDLGGLEMAHEENLYAYVNHGTSVPDAQQAGGGLPAEVNLRGGLGRNRHWSPPLAASRPGPGRLRRRPDGVRTARWGHPNIFAFPTGPAFHLSARASLEQQWEWLGRVKADYVMTTPSIVRFRKSMSGPADFPQPSPWGNETTPSMPVPPKS